jgi:hypothetical protein
MKMRVLDSIQLGQQYGKWTVIDIDDYPFFICVCTCGKSFRVNGHHLIAGKTKQCNECRVTLPRVDLVGTKVGFLTVIRYDGVKSGSRNGYPYHHWYCRCICGNEVSVRADHLGPYGQKTLSDKSCGCNRRSSKNYGWKGYMEISGQYWSQIQKGARERSIVFDLRIEDVWELFLLQKRECALTGLPLVMHITGKHAGTASLDRIDSSKGYILDNVQWVHKHINQMKLDHTQDYFISLCCFVADYYRRFY